MRFIKWRTKVEALGAAVASVEEPDYLDVEIEGYAATFGTRMKTLTNGRYILPGAFEKMFEGGSRLPAMMMLHNSSVGEVGTWTEISVTDVGLVAKGRLKNDPHLRPLRVAIVEGQVKGLSISGTGTFLNDRLGIRKALVTEISIEPRPADSRAVIYAFRHSKTAACVPESEI